MIALEHQLWYSSGIIYSVAIRNSVLLQQQTTFGVYVETLGLLWHTKFDPYGLIGKGGRYRNPQMSKFAQNCGFWPPEADTMNTFT